MYCGANSYRLRGLKLNAGALMRYLVESGLKRPLVSSRTWLIVYLSALIATLIMLGFGQYVIGGF